MKMAYIPQESSLRTPAKYHGYTYVRGTPVHPSLSLDTRNWMLFSFIRVIESLGRWGIGVNFYGFSEEVWCALGGWDSMINGCFLFLSKDGTLANRLKSPVIMDPFSWLIVYTFCVWGGYLSLNWWLVLIRLDFWTHEQLDISDISHFSLFAGKTQSIDALQVWKGQTIWKQQRYSFSGVFGVSCSGSQATALSWWWCSGSVLVILNFIISHKLWLINQPPVTYPPQK